MVYQDIADGNLVSVDLVRDELQEKADDYASLIKGAVTDLIVLVYGSVHGGAIGWKSRFIDSMDGVTESLFKGLRHSLDRK